MLALFLFVLAILATCIHSAFQRKKYVETFLRYLLLANMGLMGFLAAYAHIFMGAQTAEQIGWQPGVRFNLKLAWPISLLEFLELYHIGQA